MPPHDLRSSYAHEIKYIVVTFLSRLECQKQTDIGCGLDFQLVLMSRRTFLFVPMPPPTRNINLKTHNFKQRFLRASQRGGRTCSALFWNVPVLFVNLVYPTLIDCFVLVNRHFHIRYRSKILCKPRHQQKRQHLLNVVFE